MSPAAVTSTVAAMIGAIAFIIGLHRMRTPGTARSGNALSAAGMALVIITALITASTAGGTLDGWTALGIGLAVGGAAGAVGARQVEMTSVPQLVSLFNAVGGGAAAVLGIVAVVGAPGTLRMPLVTGIPVALDLLIGGATFTGSIIAAGKLQGIVPGRSIRIPGGRLLLLGVAVITVAGAVTLIAGPATGIALGVTAIGACAFGVLLVLPIGGADAPVVVSLLNAFTGLAVAMAGFALDVQAMIIAGALVGAAGTTLTLAMASAMNRSVLAVMTGGFGATTAAPTAPNTATENVHAVNADDVAIQLAYASNVIIVPGYGLAAGRAQHELAELAALLTAHGVHVAYAIHPVAGRMPGHMNVLLAEVDVPYEQMMQLDDANAAFSTCDVALVVGANDVTNPAARRTGNAVSGMPILNVDTARAVVVIKRSMAPGYAGISNELFTGPRTGMLFSDAKQGLTDVIAAVKQYTDPRRERNTT
ncbi:NAD(P)(+) transhydrogenase (Re/Si-specific) subunit beta [Curtobacterium sp. PhB115]|uniref:NAD(P)(+) transhydrogenase (Re/Si-specific) subunit beta n=1 Tax=Curtobacterium sp. PhB115 TaxID=2485173 RepID=UPI000F4D2520|nr:NAD(P)(+) transhydrogenase (Re/Si-specific) subunit beta [Curtobacterium sp. PhB115]ROP58658.1 NAD(P) transhydrogenase subunit beta [Curtobacterium sp. PhB115]